MKKALLIVLVMIISIGLYGCNNNTQVVDVTYTITFDTNGGSIVSSVSVDNGDTLTLPANPTKDGYTFEGWYLDPELATSFDTNGAILSDLTLYAKWTEEEDNTSNTPITYEQFPDVFPDEQINLVFMHASPSR